MSQDDSYRDQKLFFLYHAVIALSSLTRGLMGTDSLFGASLKCPFKELIVFMVSYFYVDSNSMLGQHMKHKHEFL